MKTNKQPFDRCELLKRVRQLPPKHAVAFAVLCSSRMLRNFQAFSEQSNWGDPEVLEESVRVLWRYLESDENFQDEITDCISRCSKQVPDLDEVTEDLATWGNDAALAVLYSLMCAQKGSPEHSVDTAETAYNTVDAWVQVRENLNPSDPNLEENIAANHLMKRELSFQHGSLSLLESKRSLTSDDIAKLRSLWSNNGRSNIDL